jgi:hypothetical protein
MPDLQEPQRKSLDERNQISELERLRHSCAHILATAISKIWPDAQFAAGPPVENGFYYDFDLSHRITPDDFEKIEAEMLAIVKENQVFEKSEVSRAEAAMEVEYDRSEALLANILPSSVAAKLKDPAHGVIADRYDDASILFADIAGFTERASEIPPTELVRFLDRLYTTFDRLVDRHGLEKIKTTGDSYMVVSGVPTPREDHVEAMRRRIGRHPDQAILGCTHYEIVADLFAAALPPGSR